MTGTEKLYTEQEYDTGAQQLYVDGTLTSDMHLGGCVNPTSVEDRSAEEKSNFKSDGYQSGKGHYETSIANQNPQNLTEIIEAPHPIDEAIAAFLKETENEPAPEKTDEEKDMGSTDEKPETTETLLMATQNIEDALVLHADTAAL